MPPSSSFCTLFTEQEWHDYAYSNDLKYYNDFSFGSPTDRAQGIGYVLELASRLQSNLIHSSDTSINYTYDNNREEFPVHQPFYMDMSHNSVITSVITALSLDYFKYGPHGLPELSHAPHRTFRLNKMTPFGAHLVSEVWTYPSNTSFDKLNSTIYTNPQLSVNADTTDYIRFVLNGAPLTLHGLPGCEHSENGFCEVDNFLRGIPSLKDAAMYQYACFGN